MMIFRLIAVLVFWMGLSLGGMAGGIELHRGIATDIWVTWPDDVQLRKDPLLTSVFPEWRQKVGAVQLANLRKAGFDFVRLTVDPFAYLSNASPNRTKTLNAGVVEAVKSIRAQNLNVIVDVHAIPTGGYRKFGTETYLKNEASFAAYVAAAREIAMAVADQDPDHVAFEPFNEPVVDCDYDSSGNQHKWRAMSAELHDAVREVAPKLTIVMSGACWGGADGLADLDPAAFKDENVIWSFHSYEPFAFSHQGADWTDGPERYYPAIHYPPDGKEKASVLKITTARIASADLPKARRAELLRQAKANLDDYYTPGRALALHDEPFLKVEAWAKNHEIASNRIILGEFGANRPGQDPQLLENDRLTFIELSRKAAEKRGFVWSFWSWAGSMSPTRNDADRVVLASFIRALGLDQPP